MHTLWSWRLSMETITTPDRTFYILYHSLGTVSSSASSVWVAKGGNASALFWMSWAWYVQHYGGFYAWAVVWPLWVSSGVSRPETRKHEGSGASPWKKWKRQRYQVPTDLDPFTLSLIMTSVSLPTTFMSVKGAPSAWFKYLTVARFKNAFCTLRCFQVDWIGGKSLLSIKMNISSLSLTPDKVTPVWYKTDPITFSNHQLLKLFGHQSNTSVA